MIAFDLRCAKDHVFEVWFKDSAAYEHQVSTKAVVCPTCGDKKVEKGLMAPSVGKSAPAPAPACGAPACSNGACPMSGIK